MIRRGGRGSNSAIGQRGMRLTNQRGHAPIAAARPTSPAVGRARAIICAPQPMRLGRYYLVTGRVQGVGFRYFTRAEAMREGLHGWVRNAADGGVEITAEGDREALDRFERAVRRGPPA